MTFTNGEKFDAAAVKFSIERVLDPAAHAPTISYISTLAGVDVVDDTTVHIRTKAPDPLLPTRMSRYPTYIVPPAYVKSVGNEAFARKPIGTGAYRVTAFIPDDHVTMQANTGYWRGKPSIDTVTWRALPEPTARVAALLAGEVQLVESLPVDLAQNVAADPKLDVVKVPHGGLIIYLGLKTAEKPLDDVRVRRALSMAIDRKTIVTQILKGYADPTGTQVGPFDFGYKHEPIPPFDPKAAKALLAEAGYPAGFTIRMQMPRHYINGAEVGQVIAQEFAAIGVTAQLEVPEWSVYTQQVPAGKQAPIYILGWGSTQTLDADAALYPIFRTGEPYSTVSFPAMDTLLDESRRTIDPIGARRNSWQDPGHGHRAGTGIDAVPRRFALCETQDRQLRRPSRCAHRAVRHDGRGLRPRHWARHIAAADLLCGGVLLAAIILLALLGPLCWPADPIAGSMLSMFQPPGRDAAGQFHPLGTDQIGRDLLARIIYGTRLSLAIVLMAGFVGATLGTALGLVAGYFGGAVDSVIMRLVDIQLAVPFILLILLVMAVLGPGIGNLVIVLGVTGWAIYARTARARALELRDLEFVEAARSIGASVPRILRRHMLPNLMAPQLVLLTLDLPRLVVLEASVGFLGLGVQPPTPTLGNLIGDGQSYLLNADWLVIYPGLVISALVVGFNLLGDWLARRTERRTA